MLRTNLACGVGIEPTFSELEADVLPLDEPHKLVGSEGIEPP